jgi:serine/threonine-protein kinase
MLTGKVPFEGDTSSILAQHLTKAPRPPRELNKTIPGKLESVIMVMLEKKPESRYQSIGEFMTALCYAIPVNPEQALG